MIQKHVLTVPCLNQDYTFGIILVVTDHLITEILIVFPDHSPWIRLRSFDTANGKDDAGLPIHKADYIWIYSLLIHAACITYGNQKMRDVCKALSAQFQHALAQFFCSLFKVQGWTVEFLSDAIEDAGAYRLF